MTVDPHDGRKPGSTLRRGKPLARRAWLRRGKALERRSRLPARSAKAEVGAVELEKAKNEAAARSLGRCEATHLPHECAGRGEQFHHVLPRSAGGAHSPGNLLHVCRGAHHVIHHVSPAAARRLGYLRSRYTAPDVDEPDQAPGGPPPVDWWGDDH